MSKSLSPAQRFSLDYQANAALRALVDGCLLPHGSAAVDLEQSWQDGWEVSRCSGCGIVISEVLSKG